LLAAALALGAPALLAEPARFGADAELARDDNVSRGVVDGDRKSDTLLSLGGSVTRSVLLGPRSGVVFQGGARYTHFADLGDLSNLALSGRAAYRFQPVVGFSMPWLELAGELQWLAHNDSDLRDGAIFSLTAGVGSHVTDRIRLSAGAGVERRSGGDGEVYDLSTSRLFATVDYRLGLRSTLYARLARIAGDHAFAAADPTAIAWLSAIYEASALDPALGPGFNAYRVEAKTLLYDIGFNYPLAGNQAIDVSLTHFAAETDRDAREYDGTQLRVAYLHRFQ
jgi:hypothetical protein